MPSPDKDITYFAVTDHREPKRFGIKQADRRSHVYAIGKTGVGKTTLLKAMVLQDLAKGKGLAFFDPHGDAVLDVLAQVPEHRRADVVYLDTPAGNWTFNPIADIPKGKESLAVAEMVEVFKKLWVDEWGPRLEHLWRNVLFTLIEQEAASFADIIPLLNDRELRQSIARSLHNEQVRDFWLKEFAGYSPAFRAVVTAPLLNKLGAFLTDPNIRTIICAKKSSFNLREVLEGQVLLVNLSRGQIGEGPSMLLGGMLAARIGLAGLARAEIPEEQRNDFICVLDEFQFHATQSFVSMLAELRKYRICLLMAHQYLGQLDPGVRQAVLGNVGTLICFRVSAEDAAILAREFAPTLEAVDLISLPNRHIYLKLMIDGEVSRPFSAKTIHEPHPHTHT